MVTIGLALFLANSAFMSWLGAVPWPLTIPAAAIVCAELGIDGYPTITSVLPEIIEWPQLLPLPLKATNTPSALTDVLPSVIVAAS